MTPQKEQGQAKHRAIPEAPVKNKGDVKRGDCQTVVIERLALKRRKMCSSTMTKVDEKGKGDKRQRTPSSTQRLPTPRSEVSNRTGKVVRPLRFRCKKGSCVKDKQDLRLLASPVLRLPVRKGQCRSGTICPFVHIITDARPPSPRQKGRNSKLSETSSAMRHVDPKYSALVRLQHELQSQRCTTTFRARKNSEYQEDLESVEKPHRAVQHQRSLRRRAQNEVLQKQLSDRRSEYIQAEPITKSMDKMYIVECFLAHDGTKFFHSAGQENHTADQNTSWRSKPTIEPSVPLKTRGFSSRRLVLPCSWIW